MTKAVTQKHISEHCQIHGGEALCTMAYPCDLLEEFTHSCIEKNIKPENVMTVLMAGWLNRDMQDYIKEHPAIEQRMRELIEDGRKLE